MQPWETLHCFHLSGMRCHWLPSFSIGLVISAYQMLSPSGNLTVCYGKSPRFFIGISSHSRGRSQRILRSGSTYWEDNVSPFTCRLEAWCVNLPWCTWCTHVLHIEYNISIYLIYVIYLIYIGMLYSLYIPFRTSMMHHGHSHVRSPQGQSPEPGLTQEGFPAMSLNLRSDTSAASQNRELVIGDFDLSTYSSLINTFYGMYISIYIYIDTEI